MAFSRVNSRRKRNQRQLRAGLPITWRSLRFDTLEARMLLSLNPIVPAYPQFAYDSTGQVNYSPATEAFSLTATPLSFTTTTTSSPLRVSGTRSVAIQMHVDNAGDLVVMPGDGLTVNGAVTVNGHAYSGTLLTGSIADFGFTNDTSGDTPPNTDTDAYYFSFQPTGGSMVALFGSGDIGFQASSEHSTFAGSFQTSFTGGAKGTIGPIGAPSITTVSGGTVVVGSGTPLTDSATLSGGQGPTGTITFQLTGPGNTVVDTETVAVNGNGTYNTPTGYLPTAVGTYQWVASYSGDASNVTVSSAIRRRTGDREPGQRGIQHDPRHDQHDVGGEFGAADRLGRPGGRL